MRDRYAEQGEAQIATVASVNSQLTKPDNEIPPERRITSPGGPGHRPMPPRRRTHTSVLAAASASALAILLLVLLADAGRTTASTTKVTPTATPKPTATATPFPSPTPMLGFQVYMDRSDGFVIQYPHTWVYSQVTPGVQFDDDTSNIAYEVQVLLPGDATSAGGPTTSPDDASVWVNYEMQTLSKQFQGDFQQEPGPCTASVLVSGWQCGIATISGNQTVIEVMVNATVHDGKPYIINELASEDRFRAGQQQFFWPMERSFQFLPAGS